MVAEVGVQRCAAARADEFCAVGCGCETAHAGVGSAGGLPCLLVALPYF